MAEASGRVLPELDRANEFFWTSGEDGVLRFQRCIRRAESCATPRPRCAPTATPPRWTAADGLGPRHGRRVHGQRAPVAARASAAVRDRDRRHRGGRPRPPHHQHRRTCDRRRRVHRACRSRCGSSTHDDVWIPLFEPTGEPEQGPVPAPTTEIHDARPCRWRRDKFEDKVAISGHRACRARPAAHARPARRSRSRPPSARSPTPGSRVDDIDGLSTYPGGVLGGGIPRAASPRWRTRCGYGPRGSTAGSRRPGQAGSVDRGDARGRRRPVQARPVLPHRVGGDVRRQAARGDERCARQLGAIVPWAYRIGGDMQWRIPYGASSAANWIGMKASAALAPLRHDPRDARLRSR